MYEVADSSNWGTLYQQKYSNLSAVLSINAGSQRSIILPYTHKAELYAEPDSRVFQIISGVNEQTKELTAEKNVAWSKTLGLLSIKSIALDNNFSPTDNLIFPSIANIDVNQALDEIRNDSGFTTLSQTNSSQILDNHNALPLLYASSHYVYYDDVGTLKYALNYVDFKNLPVFLQSTGNSRLQIPSYATEDKYTLYALSLQQNLPNSTLPLTINNRNLALERQRDCQNLTTYSTSLWLSAGDTINIPQPEAAQTNQLKDVTLNSTSTLIGNLGSFTLDFNVSIVKNGDYSYLGPRVMFDCGTEQYFLIIHDNGFLELAIEQDGNFKSNVATRFVGYNLLDPDASINVKVVRHFDVITVFIQDIPYLTFTTLPQYSNVFLSSEHSISKFSNITLSENLSIRLFAIRQNTAQPIYTVQQSGAEQSALTANSSVSDFAVVSQYLYTQLSHASGAPSSETVANVFFKAWIFTDNPPTNISIDTDNRLMTFAVIGFSIIFSYTVLFMLILHDISPKLYCKLTRTRKNEGDQPDE